MGTREGQRQGQVSGRVGRARPRAFVAGFTLRVSVLHGAFASIRSAAGAKRNRDCARGARSCPALLLPLGVEGPPTGTAGLRGEGPSLGRSRWGLFPIPRKDDGIRKSSVEEVLLAYNKTVIDAVWRLSRAGAGAVRCTGSAGGDCPAHTCRQTLAPPHSCIVPLPFYFFLP